MIEAVEFPINVHPASSFGITVGLVPAVCLDTVLETVLEHTFVENGLDNPLSCLPRLELIELEKSRETCCLNPIAMDSLEDVSMDCKFSIMNGSDHVRLFLLPGWTFRKKCV